MRREEQLMHSAIREADTVLGTTYPNPAVGAVIEHQGEMVATGGTAPAGGPHAEIRALENFQSRGLEADASTRLIVTMEPCSTEGRTGACTEAILKSGISCVVVGTLDPNPAHAGRGLDILRSAGIQVESGILEESCRDLNLLFNWMQEKQRPLIAAKIATTLDGRIATRGGLSKWITGPESRADVHRWRSIFPSLAVGAGTVKVDNPSLTIRRADAVEGCPIRFIFDRNLTTFNDSEFPGVYTDAFRERTILLTMEDRIEEARRFQKKFGFGDVWGLRDRDDDEGLRHFCDLCWERKIGGVYVEGGAHLLSNFLRHRLLHYLFAYRAPKLLADTSGLAPFMGEEPEDMDQCIDLRDIRLENFGSDQLMRGFVNYPD